MKKGSKSSWDKKQVRRLERYLKANGYICMGTRRGGSDHIKYTSSITGRSTIYFERELKNYEVILVRQKITEDYLYRVIAQNKITGKYAVW